MVLKICCKSSLVYLGTKSAAAKITARKKFALGVPAGWLDNSLSNQLYGKKSKKAMEGRSL